MKHETGTAITKARYYGVRETCTLLDGDTLELIHGVYPAKPEEAEEFSGSKELVPVLVHTRWYETAAQARSYYEERRREMFGETDEDDEGDEGKYARRRSLQADEDVKHAVEHGYAEYGFWR
jgi:hypothetical protein